MPLKEDGRFVSFTVSVSVLQDHDSIPFVTFVSDQSLVGEGPVVDRFADPDSTEMIDVDVCGIEQIGFARKERGFKTLTHIQLSNRIGQFVAPIACCGRLVQ